MTRLEGGASQSSDGGGDLRHCPSFLERPILSPSQGPLQIGSGCLLTGLDVSSSPALQRWQLCDVVLQGHTIRLQDMLRQVFTLTGRHDDWQVLSETGLGVVWENQWIELRGSRDLPSEQSHLRAAHHV